MPREARHPLASRGSSDLSIKGRLSRPAANGGVQVIGSSQTRSLVNFSRKSMQRICRKIWDNCARRKAATTKRIRERPRSTWQRRRSFCISHMSVPRLLLLIAWLGVIPFALCQVPSPSGTPMATADRVPGPGWWPTKGTPAREEYLGPDACGQCHRAKVNSTRKTPMAHASMAAADSETLRSHDRLEAQIGPYHYEIVRMPAGSVYSVSAR